MNEDEMNIRAWMDDGFTAAVEVIEAFTKTFEDADAEEKFRPPVLELYDASIRLIEEAMIAGAAVMCVVQSNNLEGDFSDQEDLYLERVHDHARKSLTLERRMLEGIYEVLLKNRVAGHE